MSGGQVPVQATVLQDLWQVVQAQPAETALWHLSDWQAHQHRYLADLRLIEALAPDGPILEIGSAPCHMTALLHLSGHAAVGVDVSPARVDTLIRQLGLDVRACDVERSALPFPDASFACAMLCETFEHLRVDPAFVLSEIHRVLRPGAPLLLTTPNLYALPSLARFALGRSIADPWLEFEKLRTLGHMGHVREYSAREVLRFVQFSGFGLQSLDYRSHPGRGGRKDRLLRAAYALAPRCFRREIVVVARKLGPGLRLQPLEPG